MSRTHAASTPKRSNVSQRPTLASQRRLASPRLALAKKTPRNSWKRFRQLPRFAPSTNRFRSPLRNAGIARKLSARLLLTPPRNKNSKTRTLLLLHHGFFWKPPKQRSTKDIL